MKGSVQIVRLTYTQSTGHGQDASETIDDRTMGNHIPYICGESEGGMMDGVTAELEYAQSWARTIWRPADAARVCENNQWLVIRRFIYYR